MVLQQVRDKRSLSVEEQDFSSLSESERRMQADALAARICQTAFDLAVPPHLRVALARLSEEEHVLFVVFHHTIIDGSSMGTFFDDLASGRAIRRLRLARFSCMELLTISSSVAAQ